MISSKDNNDKEHVIHSKNDNIETMTVTVPLNHEEIKKTPQRITKIKIFINK